MWYSSRIEERHEGSWECHLWDPRCIVRLHPNCWAESATLAAGGGGGGDSGAESATLAAGELAQKKRAPDGGTTTQQCASFVDRLPHREPKPKRQAAPG